MSRRGQRVPIFLCSAQFIGLLFLTVTRLSCSSFSPPRVMSTRTSRVLHSASSGEEVGDAEAFKRKMATVRALQKSFYGSLSSETPTSISADGIIDNLPLWRVPWTELPGRSNILMVHETLYTNMFETILNGEQPLKNNFIFGHLFLENGSKSLKNGDESFRLKSWEKESDFAAQRKTGSMGGSAVVGTLLRIVDYRRMSDGNLLLLVQALERFVVVKPVKELPYSIANVQLLPDWEEIYQGNSEVYDSDESEASKMRVEAITKSFRYYAYEYDRTVRLPLPEREDLSKSEVFGPNLTKVLPLVPLSSTVDLADIADDILPSQNVVGSDPKPETEPETGFGGDQTLEARLVKGRVMRELSPHPEIRSYSAMSVDELEEKLWHYMDEYVSVTQSSLHSDLLSLLPHNRTWPDSFLLASIVASLEASDSSFVRVSNVYPSYRRQKRLSFVVSVLIEKTAIGDLRQILLEIPSTHARLCAIVERFELVNSDLVGEFM